MTCEEAKKCWIDAAGGELQDHATPVNDLFAWWGDERSTVASKLT